MRWLVLALVPVVLLGGLACGPDRGKGSADETTRQHSRDATLCSRGAELGGEAMGHDDQYAPCDPYPEKSDGTESHEFEPEDIEAAKHASEEVWRYCTRRDKSEAQLMGCLGHVTNVP